MNRVSLTGHLHAKGIPFGEGLNGVRFLIRTTHKYTQNSLTKEASNVVSCAMFNCPEDLRQLLLEGDKNLWIETEGMIRRSAYDTDRGERRYSQEVLVNPLTMTTTRK